MKHYDLCVTALKHTEGGGEAINQAASTEGHDQEASALAGLGVDLGKLDETPPKPMSEEERTEMLAVLAKDAAEVEDVVSEIKDQLAEMEDQLAHVEAYLQTLRDTSKRLKQGLGLLKHVAGNVPSYITACAVFQGAWEDEKVVLTEKKEGLEGLKEFYSGFADAYDGLIVEVQRRKNVKRETEKVIKAAMGELEKLYQGMFRSQLGIAVALYTNYVLSGSGRKRELSNRSSRFYSQRSLGWSCQSANAVSDCTG